MEREKRRRGLDQSYGSALKKLDDLIAAQIEQSKPMAPDEFTAEVYSDKLKAAGLEVSIDAARHRLKRMVRLRQCESRTLFTKNKWTRVYRIL